MVVCSTNTSSQKPFLCTIKNERHTNTDNHQPNGFLACSRAKKPKRVISVILLVVVPEKQSCLTFATTIFEKQVHAMAVDEIPPQMVEYWYLGILLTTEGRMERESDRQIVAASTVMQTRSVVVKKV